MTTKERVAGVWFLATLALGLWNVDRDITFLWYIIFVSFLGACILYGYASLLKSDKFNSEEAMRRLNNIYPPVKR